METRTLYLKRGLRINDRKSGGLAGEQLYEEFGRISGRCLLAHQVDDSNAASTDQRFEGEFLSEAEVREYEPNVVYLEGGLFPPLQEGVWRVPRPLSEDLVSTGTVFMVADVDTNKLSYDGKRAYREAADFLKASVDYPDSDSRPVYASDRSNARGGDRQFALRPEEMDVADWLRPVYEGIGEILVGAPACLAACESVLASGNRRTTVALHSDLEEYSGCVPLAAVAEYGEGYVVFIAGAVSGDVWVEKGADNPRWISNLVEFLLGGRS